MADKLSIISVSYNSEEFIEKFVKSVLKFKPKSSELIILDNGSSDNTVDLLKKFGGQIILIESSENLGFSKGNNRAAKEATGEYLFFLNPDTEVSSNIFDELLDFYEESNDAGIVAPKLVMADGKTQSSVKKVPTVWGAFEEFVLGVRNAYSQYTPKAEEAVEVDVVYGAAILISKEIFDSLGGFDEKYFLYYEDVDLCDRVRNSGKKVYYYPKVFVKHLVGATKSLRNKYQLNSESAKIYHRVLGYYFLQLIFLVPRIKRKFGLKGIA